MNEWTDEPTNHRKHGVEEDPVGAGGRSFNLINVRKFLGRLEVQKGMTVVDLACGYGHYSFELSKAVGGEGIVYAVDLWEKGIESIEKKIREKNIENIKAVCADVSKKIPLPDQSADLCLMAAVLHDLLRDHTYEGTLKEVHRIMKGDGCLAVIEFKVIDGPPGPPKKIRIDPRRTEEIIRPFGFSLSSTTDLGPYAYLSIYRKTGGQPGGPRPGRQGRGPGTGAACQQVFRREAGGTIDPGPAPENPNPPSNSKTVNGIGRFGAIPDHQKGVRCKASETGDPTKLGSLWSPSGPDKKTGDPPGGWGVCAFCRQIPRNEAHIELRRSDEG